MIKAMLISWILDRLKEKSTYQGIALMAAAAGVGIDPDNIEQIAGVGVAVVGAIQFAGKEKAA